MVLPDHPRRQLGLHGGTGYRARRYGSRRRDAQSLAAGAEKRIFLRIGSGRRKAAAGQPLRHRHLGQPCGHGDRPSGREPRTRLRATGTMGSARTVGRSQLAGDVGGRRSGRGLHTGSGQSTDLWSERRLETVRHIQAQSRRLEYGSRVWTNYAVSCRQHCRSANAQGLSESLRSSDRQRQVGC